MTRMVDAGAPVTKGRVELSREAGFWVLGGFFGFGSVVGGLTGASQTSGIAQTLMTGLLSFAGGSLLTLIGFVFKNDHNPEIRAKAAGQALVGLALGVWFGVVAGVSARIWFERHEDERVARAVRAAQAEAAKARQGQGSSAGERTPSTASLPASATNEFAEPSAAPVAIAANASAPVPTRTPLLHASQAGCDAHLRLIRAREASGYYVEVPAARADDLATKELLCRR